METLKYLEFDNYFINCAIRERLYLLNKEEE